MECPHWLLTRSPRPIAQVAPHRIPVNTVVAVVLPATEYLLLTLAEERSTKVYRHTSEDNYLPTPTSYQLPTAPLSLTSS